MTLLNELIGGETFLQGKYLSVGVNSTGGIGTRYAAPKEFETDVSYTRVGLVADLDGFGTGEAALRDAVVRGAPIEGFNIGYKVGASTYIHSNQEMTGLTEIAGKSSTSATADAVQADWKGATTEKLGVNQKITLAEDAKYIRFEITLTNNSAAAMNDLRYMRTVDPDMGRGEVTNTINKIVKQGSDGALITAAETASGEPMFLYTSDTRAIVSSYGLINESPYKDAAVTAQKAGTTFKSNSPMNINFGLGELSAGESTTIVFYMGVTDDLAATVAEIDASSTPSRPTKPAENAAPDANDDALTIVSGETGKGNVLANDTDANKDALTAKLKSGPSHGTVTLAADGSYVYKAVAGYSGSDSFTYTASDGKTSDTATVAITVAPKPVVNAAPDANNDALTTVSGETGKGNVLANDTDANKDALTAKLKSGPSHGTVTLAADGSYVYKAVAGYSGSDSFTYTASDGKASATATVAIAVAAPVVTSPTLPVSDLVQRAGTVDGSASASSKLAGIKGHNSFFFDLDAKSGKDQITNFERDDVLVLNGMLEDGNGDGTISFSKNKLSLGNGDTVTIKGVSSLRYLGTDKAGLSVYGNAAVDPKGAIESRIGDDTLAGDTRDAKKDVFFFDTSLDIDLGNDRIDDFGAKDLLVTTTALSTTALGKNGVVELVGASGDLGTVDLNDTTGAAIGTLEFDGSIVRSGVTYYVYSQAGSSAGLADLAF